MNSEMRNRLCTEDIKNRRHPVLGACGYFPVPSTGKSPRNPRSGIQGPLYRSGGQKCSTFYPPLNLSSYSCVKIVNPLGCNGLRNTTKRHHLTGRFLQHNVEIIPGALSACQNRPEPRASDTARSPDNRSAAIPPVGLPWTFAPAWLLRKDL